LHKTAICFFSCLKILRSFFDKETWVSMSADVKDDACEMLLMPLPRIPAPAALEHPAHQVTPGTPGPALAYSLHHTR
jgi:hypothetical protein